MQRYCVGTYLCYIQCIWNLFISNLHFFCFFSQFCEASYLYYISKIIDLLDTVSIIGLSFLSFQTTMSGWLGKKITFIDFLQMLKILFYLLVCELLSYFSSKSDRPGARVIGKQISTNYIENSCIIKTSNSLRLFNYWCALRGFHLKTSLEWKVKEHENMRTSTTWGENKTIDAFSSRYFSCYVRRTLTLRSFMCITTPWWCWQLGLSSDTSKVTSIKSGVYTSLAQCAGGRQMLSPACIN